MVTIQASFNFILAKRLPKWGIKESTSIPLYLSWHYFLQFLWSQSHSGASPSPSYHADVLILTQSKHPLVLQNLFQSS